MTEYADPAKHFAVELHLSAVRHEDYDALRDALGHIVQRFAQGGSSVSIEHVNPESVINRFGRKPQDAGATDA